MATRSHGLFTRKKDTSNPTEPPCKMMRLSETVPSLPDGVWIDALSKLDAGTLIRVAAISRWFTEITSNEYLWKNLCESGNIIGSHPCLLSSKKYSSTSNGVFNYGYFKALHVKEAKKHYGLKFFGNDINEVTIGETLVTGLTATAKHIFTASFIGAVKVWAVPDLQLLKVVPGVSAVICMVATESFLICSYRDGTVKAWHIESLACATILQEYIPNSCMKVWKNNLFIGSVSAIHNWNISSGKWHQATSYYTLGVTCMDVDSDIIVTGSSNGNVRIWDTVSLECRCDFADHVGIVCDVQIRGFYFVTIGLTNNIHLRRKGSFERITTISVPPHGTVHLADHFLVADSGLSSFELYAINQRRTYNINAEFWGMESVIKVIRRSIIFRDHYGNIGSLTLAKDYTTASLSKLHIPMDSFIDHESVDENRLIYVAYHWLPNNDNTSTLCVMNFTD